jgi:hypothetical protein
MRVAVASLFTSCSRSAAAHVAISRVEFQAYSPPSGCRDGATSVWRPPALNSMSFFLASVSRNSLVWAPSQKYHQCDSRLSPCPLVRVGSRYRPARATASGTSRSTSTSHREGAPVKSPTFCPLLQQREMSSSVYRSSCQPGRFGFFEPGGTGIGAYPSLR